MARGMKLSFGKRYTYDHVFFWMAIVIACIVMNDACCIIFGRVELAMTTSTEAQKPSLVIKKSIHRVWWKKRWETSFYINVPLSKEYHELQCIHSCIGTKVSGYPNHQWYVHTNTIKDVTCAIVGCDKPRRVNIVKKWIKDKWNANVLGWVNNQVPATKLAQDRKHVHVVAKGTSIRNVANSCSCR
jgi:hypothetical protein